MEASTKLVALYEVAKMQVEVMDKIIDVDGHDNPYADGLREGWRQALRAVERMMFLEDDK